MLAKIVKFFHINFLDNLVAVDHKDPVIGGISQGKIPGGREIVTPRKVEHLICLFGGNFLRAVRGAGVHYHNFKTIGLDGSQAFFDAGFFIFSDNAYGYGMHEGLLYSYVLLILATQAVGLASMKLAGKVNVGFAAASFSSADIIS